MKILLIACHFPPFNSIASLRTGKMAKYLNRFGHDIRVLTLNEDSLSANLPIEVPKEHVISTSWLDINFPVKGLSHLLKFPNKNFSPTPNSLSAYSPSLLKKAWFFYRDCLNFPDLYVGWYPFGVYAGIQLTRQWKPDIIYASAPQYTALLIASRLSNYIKVPWIAELRDLWIDNPYIQRPLWRDKIENLLEKKILLSSSGIITVSQPLTKVINNKFSLPTYTITNGFDAEDFLDLRLEKKSSKTLNIVYTGKIYDGYRNPLPLIQAISKMQDLSSHIRVDFYGTHSYDLENFITKYNLTDVFTIHPMVTYKESLTLQMEADILLLLTWNNQSEKGVYTGKLFEYIGARRPILAIGSMDNVAADLIRERKVGIVENDPDKLAAILREWIAIKQSGQNIPSTPVEALQGLSREDQAKQLVEFFDECLQHEKN